MKKALFAFVMTVNLCVALAIAPVHAQSRDALVVNVPFAFNVGQQTLPAGKYTLVRGSSILSPGVWTIRGEDAHAMLLANPGNDETGQVDPKLIFNRYGDTRFLATISAPSGRDYTVPRSHAERVASRSTAHETIAVLAK